MLQDSLRHFCLQDIKGRYQDTSTPVHRLGRNPGVSGIHEAGGYRLVDRKSLQMTIQDLKEKLMDREVTSYQWIPTCLMWADALTKEMEVHGELQEVMMEGNVKLANDGINLVQCMMKRF